MKPAKFVTIPDVVILESGDWNAGSGPFKPTAEHIAGAVDAYNDGAMWAPRGKIGDTVHAKTGKAVGRYENLRVGQRIDKHGNVVHRVVADHACVPAEFAANMPSEYPGRSIEGRHNVTIRGKRYPFVITHVELLGVDGPAVTSLPDITPAQVEAALGEVAASAGDAVLGDVVTEPVEAAWQDQQIDAQTIQIVLDGRVIAEMIGDPSTVSAVSTVHVVETGRESLASDSTTEDQMDSKAIRAALKLPDDATDEQVLEAATKAGGDTQPAGDAPTGDTPAGDAPAGDKPVEASAADDADVVKLSAGRWAEVEAELSESRKLRERLSREEDERAIQKALQETRITASEAGTPDAPGPIRKRLAVDELRESTLVLLTASVEDGGLAPGIVPVMASGTTGSDEVAASADEDAIHARAMARINGDDA